MKRSTLVLTTAAVIGPWPAAALAGGQNVSSTPDATRNAVALSDRPVGTKAPRVLVNQMAGSCSLYDNGASDDSNGYSNGTVEAFGIRRTLLDDFEVPNGQIWTLTELHHEHVWNTMNPGSGTGMEILIRTDAGGNPGPELQVLTVTNYQEMSDGRTAFNRPVVDAWTTFEPVALGPGRYWFEATVVGPENNFWMVRTGVTGTECWINYEDLGFHAGSAQFGTEADLGYCLSGSAEVGPVFAFGLRHDPLGEALLATDGGNVVVSNIGSSGLDGVSVDIGDGAGGWLGNGSLAAHPPFDAEMNLLPIGTVGGVPDTPVGGLSLGVETDNIVVRPDVVGVGGTMYTLNLSNGDELVFSQGGIPTGLDFIFVPRDQTLTASFFSEVLNPPNILWGMETPTPVNLELLAGNFLADGMDINPDDADLAGLESLNRIDLTLGGTSDLTLDRESLIMYGFDATAVGGVRLDTTTNGHLVISNIGSGGGDGVTFGLDSGLVNIDMGTLPASTEQNASILRQSARGTVSGGAGGGVDLGNAAMRNTGGLQGVFVDFSAIGSGLVRVQIFDDGALVNESVETGGGRVALVLANGGDGHPLVTAIGITAVDTADPSGFVFRYDRDGNFIPTSGGLFLGDEVRVLAENPTVDVTCLLAFLITATDIRDENGDGGLLTFTAGSGVACDDKGEPCPEDLSGNGEVDFADILAVLEAWGNKGGPEDLDGSGFVDFGDILRILEAWGPCP